jgi:hypothetical protein
MAVAELQGMDNFSGNRQTDRFLFLRPPPALNLYLFWTLTVDFPENSLST